MNESNLSGLNDRARYLLKTLVDCYIREGKPVGSKALAEAAGLHLSSATIRNVMASLDHMGLVSAPHTSAGRIPTAQGMRLFIDSLLEVAPLEDTLVSTLKSQLDPDQNRDRLIDTASNLLSEITRLAGIITIPRRSHESLRQVEFLPLSDRRVLAILVINEKEVMNKVIHVDREYSQDELQRIANYLTQNFAGQDIFDIRQNLLRELKQARDNVDDLMRAAVEIADQALSTDDSRNEDFVVQGQANLLRYDQAENTARLQQLFDMFERKRDMLSLLDRCLQAEDIQIFIGREAGVEGLGEFSVITAPYSANGEVLGVLGVIGPTRMEYSRVIPVVDVTAQLLGMALKPTEK